MKQILHTGRVVLFLAVAAMLSMAALAGVSASAQIRGTDPGVGRGGGDIAISLTVTLKGKPVGGAKVTIKTDSGVETSSGMTSAAGRFRDKLDEGDYTVTIVSGDQTMNKTIHVVKSKRTMFVSIKLDAPTPPAPPKP